MPFGTVEQQLFELRQLLGAELRLAPGAAREAQGLDASLGGLLRPAAHALLADTEAAGHFGLVESLIEQPQGSQAALFESFEIAFDSSRIPHTYGDGRQRETLLYIMRTSIIGDIAACGDGPVTCGDHGPREPEPARSGGNPNWRTRLLRLHLGSAPAVRCSRNKTTDARIQFLRSYSSTFIVIRSADVADRRNPPSPRIWIADS